MSWKPPRDVLPLSWEEHGATRRYIDEQITFIATLEPGCEAHRIATDMLLLLTDGLALLVETRALVKRLQSRESDGA